MVLRTEPMEYKAEPTDHEFDVVSSAQQMLEQFIYT